MITNNSRPTTLGVQIGRQETAAKKALYEQKPIEFEASARDVKDAQTDHRYSRDLESKIMSEIDWALAESYDDHETGRYDNIRRGASSTPPPSPDHCQVEGLYERDLMPPPASGKDDDEGYVVVGPGGRRRKADDAASVRSHDAMSSAGSTVGQEPDARTPFSGPQIGPFNGQQQSPFYGPRPYFVPP